jgi:hypothetical protein
VGGGGPKQMKPGPSGFGVVPTVAAGVGQKLTAGAVKEVAVVFRLQADTQPPLPQELPLGQHVRLAPLPQGVRPAGHPQTPLVRSAQATPDLQHTAPHGVVPAGQQNPMAGSEQVPVQQPEPQLVWPEGQPHVFVEGF